jgi:hypothetical protein
MFNPFHPFTTPLLDAFIKSGKLFFVRQTFNRGRNTLDTTCKGAFLITHYSDLSAAEAHYHALEEDANRYLYFWSREEDSSRLKVAAAGPENYKIYSALFQKEWEARITDRLKKQINAYITSLGWRPGKGEGVLPDFYLQFGDLYVQLKWGKRQVRVKFEEIENH